MTWVKICGVTRVEDALSAVREGADAIGLVFAESRRRVVPRTAREIVRAIAGAAMTVGVFRDASADELTRIADETGIDAVQLHGGESRELARAADLPVIRRVRPPRAGTAHELARGVAGWSGAVWAVLLDPGDGAGRPFDWRIARGLPGRVALAGGLSAENVGAAIRAARPFGVDVSSSLECSPGVKDPVRVAAFLRAVEGADARLDAR